MQHDSSHLLEEMRHLTDEALGLWVDGARRRGNTAAVARRTHATNVTVWQKVIT